MLKPSLIQNLKDAGCSASVIDKFMDCYQAQFNVEQKRLLAAHRSSLLDKIHKNKKRLDCLDYLIYQLNHNGPVKKKV
jgi:DNA-binding transcriptional MerR regulator